MFGRRFVVLAALPAFALAACSSASSSSSSSTNASKTDTTTIVTKATNCGEVSVPAGWEQSELPYANGTRLQWANPDNPENILVLTVGTDRQWDKGNGVAEVKQYVPANATIDKNTPYEFDYRASGPDDTAIGGIVLINSLAEKTCDGTWVGLAAQFPSGQAAQGDGLVRAFANSYKEGL